MLSGHESRRKGDSLPVRLDLKDFDGAKALAEYQDFLTLWKDADPDIPVLKEAKAEYAKLQ